MLKSALMAGAVALVLGLAVTLVSPVCGLCIALFTGPFNIMLMAILGAVGGILWRQLSRRPPVAPEPVPTTE